jgi:tRNA1(Val) A37 N6-methylase TrmN6
VEIATVDAAPVMALPAERGFALQGGRDPVRIRARVIRPTFTPMNLPQQIHTLISSGDVSEPGEWVIGAAQEKMARAVRSDPPWRWLRNLSTGFPSVQVRDASAFRARLVSGLPDEAWKRDELLGEVLLAARACRAPERTGRSGRRSRVEVYTPPELAAQMAASVHIGSKRAIDPCCGSGAFLMTLFHRAFERRVNAGAEARESARAALTLDFAGLDTDREALAVAEFNLRFAAWEKAGFEEDAVLPLRCADALGPLPDFDGRFDVVIGNPPFVEGRGLPRAYLAWLRTCFRCAAEGKVNLFTVFVERGLTLLREGGVLNYILPATFLRNERYRGLRELLLTHTLEAITPVPVDCFPHCVVETVILRVRKERPGGENEVLLMAGTAPQNRLAMGPALRFCPSASESLRHQVERMERRGVPLSDHFDVRDGISTGFQPFQKRLLGRVQEMVFVAEDGTKHPFDAARHRPVIDGREFTAFTPVRWGGRYIEYDKRHEHAPPHPGRPFNCQLRQASIYDRPEKMLTRQTANGLIATVDLNRYFVRNSVHVTYARDAAAGFSIQALCACVNSAFYLRYFLAVTGEDGAIFPQVHVADIKRLPLLPELLRDGGRLTELGAQLLALHAAVEHPDPAVKVPLLVEIEVLLENAFCA